MLSVGMVGLSLGIIMIDFVSNGPAIVEVSPNDNDQFCEPSLTVVMLCCWTIRG